MKLSSTELFSTIFIRYFLSTELFDSSVNLDNLFESSSIKTFLSDFLIDYFLCLNISFLALEILKFSLSGLILINSQPNSFSNAFCLCISSLVFLS